MKVVYIFHILQLSLIHLYRTVAEDYRQAYFSITATSVYIPLSSANFLANVTLNSMSDLPACAQQCFNHATCQTAVFYRNMETCSLFSESSNIGQILAETNQVTFVLSITGARSTATVSSSNFTWSMNGITVAGNPLGSSGSSLRELSVPTGMFYDRPYKQIIVSDYFNRRILRFSLMNLSADGVVIAGGNGYGCGLNQFADVSGVALDSSRQLYVADFTCDRILRFPPDSNSTTPGVLFTSVNSPEEMFFNPSTDDLYVSVNSPPMVMKFSRNSTIPMVFAGGNGDGNGLNQFNAPVGVYFDYLNTNSLYVADVLNHRVMRFPANSTNATYGTIVAGGNGPGNALNQLNRPTSVFVDSNGILYITDQNNNRVQRWLPNASSGDTIVGGTSGQAPNQLSGPDVVFFDENWNLFVVDSFNNRVQFFNSSQP